MKPSLEREQRLFDALKRITKYLPPDRIRGRYADSAGLSDEEAIEYAYDNVLEEAKRAIKGMRRPTLPSVAAGVTACDAHSESKNPLMGGKDADNMNGGA